MIGIESDYSRQFIVDSNELRCLCSLHKNISIKFYRMNMFLTTNLHLNYHLSLPVSPPQHDYRLALLLSLTGFAFSSTSPYRSMFGKKILGYPIRLQNESYARNAFYFNLCFVFQPTTRTICYEPVVKKLTEHLISLERSDNILSQIKLPDNCDRIRRILNRVRDDLNRDKKCMLQGGYLLNLILLPNSRCTLYVEICTTNSHQLPSLLVLVI